MKKLLLLSALSIAAYASCADKIYHLEKELDYARMHGNIHKEQGVQRALDRVRAKCGGVYDSRYYDRYDFAKSSLEREYDLRIDGIEDELDRLDDIKDTMSKSEYKARKAELKARKKSLKEEYKSKKQDLKARYKY